MKYTMVINCIIFWMQINENVYKQDRYQFIFWAFNNKNIGQLQVAGNNINDVCNSNSTPPLRWVFVIESKLNEMIGNIHLPIQSYK